MTLILRCQPKFNPLAGSLISKYLANHPSRRSFSFAIAGRSLKKLQALANDLSLSPNVAKFAFDVGNDAEVVEVVKKAKVIINCIGPFWKCSTPIVQYVCIRSEAQAILILSILILSIEHAQLMGYTMLISAVNHGGSRK